MDEASVFKARCLAVMKDVQATGEPVIVTKRGEPVLKVVSVESEKSDLFGFMARKFKIVGDIERPVVPLKHWKSMKNGVTASRTDPGETGTPAILWAKTA